MKIFGRCALVLGSLLGILLAGCGGGGGASTSKPSDVYFACVVNQGTAPGIVTYAVDAQTGTLGDLKGSKSIPGYPQWVAAHPTRNVVYVTTHDDHVYAYSVDAASGALTLIDTEAEATDSTPTKAVVTPDGQYLYVALADGHRISVYSIGTDGTLAFQSAKDLGAGNNPTDLAVDPNGAYLYALEQSTAVLHAYSIGTLGALTETVLSPYTCGGNPRNLATRLDNLYVNYYDSTVFQYTDQPTPLTAMIDPSVPATGNSLACAVVGDYFYRYEDTYDHIYRYSFAASGGGLESPRDVSSVLPDVTQLTGGIGGKVLYSVHPNVDRIDCFSITASTGELGSQVEKSTADVPICLAIVKAQ